MKQKITVHVRLSPSQFRKFCRFDNFRRQHRWFVPIMTGMIMITISMALLFFGKSRSDTMPGILMGLGIAFPLFAFGMYTIQIESQIAKQNLKKNPEIYILELTTAGLGVTGAMQVRSRVDLPWTSMWGAFRRKGDIYLYATPARAFILPAGQADVPDAQVWKMITQYMGEKCFDT